MTIGSTKELVATAAAHGYAVPAVNIVDFFSMQGVVDAAEQMKSPVILQTSTKTVRMMSAEVLAAMHKRVAEAASVPVALHLDHCPDREIVSRAIRSGWSSVLFDVSDRGYDDAFRETLEVVAEAHGEGVAVESEIENIAGVEDGIGADEQGHLYSTEKLMEFVVATECDLFAPALGTAHGLYSSRPMLLPERAEQLVQSLRVPIVLHGGSGLTPDEFRAFIAAGCAKINISTTLKVAYLRALGEAAEKAAEKKKWEPPAAFAHAQQAVQADIARHIEIFGSQGRAS